MGLSSHRALVELFPLTVDQMGDGRNVCHKMRSNSVHAKKIRVKRDPWATEITLSHAPRAVGERSEGDLAG